MFQSSYNLCIDYIQTPTIILPLRSSSPRSWILKTCLFGSNIVSYGHTAQYGTTHTQCSDSTTTRSYERDTHEKTTAQNVLQFWKSMPSFAALAGCNPTASVCCASKSNHAECGLLWLPCSEDMNSPIPVLQEFKTFTSKIVLRINKSNYW